MPKRPFTQSLSSYTDVEQVFNKALTSGKVFLLFPDRRKAAHFVARANKFRVLWRKTESSIGRPFASPFDHLKVSQTQVTTAEGDACWQVSIQPRGFDFLAATDAEGNPITFDYVTGETAAARPEQAQQDEDFFAEYTLGLKETK